MTDREKLIELLADKCDWKAKRCIGCERGFPFAKECKKDRFGGIADYLLANGVTFAKDINVPSRWIPVAERMPNPGVVVLVYSKLGCTYFSHRLYNHVEGKPFCIEYSGGWEITHWMPLPEPPKEGE